MIDEIAKRLGVSGDVAKDILRIYLGLCEEVDLEIRSCVEKGNTMRVAALLHKLAGATESIFEFQLGLEIRAIEDFVLQGGEVPSAAVFSILDSVNILREKIQIEMAKSQ